MCVSVPQIPQAATLTTTSPSRGTGIGSSRDSTTPGLSNTTARIQTSRFGTDNQLRVAVARPSSRSPGRSDPSDQTVSVQADQRIVAQAGPPRNQEPVSPPVSFNDPPLLPSGYPTTRSH